MRRPILRTAIVLSVLAVQIAAQPAPAPRAGEATLPAPRELLPPAKALSASPSQRNATLPEPREPALPGPQEGDRPLPINLATALRLADARPLVIEAARAAVETEFGLYQQARVLWLPNVNLGADYQNHEGGFQNLLTGQLIDAPRNQFLAGGGAQAVFALTDAIYSPLAARQLMNARNLDVQTAKNDALLLVAVAYFDVQQARGILAGALDSAARARELARRVGSLGKGLAPAIEVERVYATLAEVDQQAASALQDWRFNSASLTRVLRLDPEAVVVPLEPPHLQITVVAPQALDALIVAGLTSRPELASQQSVVQATLTRLRQERMRPLIPSLALQSNATPNGTLGAGAFGTGSSALNNWNGRSDWDAQIYWQFRNLGAGNRGLVAERRGEQRQAMVELFRIQDQVAEEVRQAHAQLEAAAVRVRRAEDGLKAALASYEGNLKGLSEFVRNGELLVLVNRPQEVVAALQQSYVNYYTSANDYNRAQFRLYRAIGYPAQNLGCRGPFGPVVQVDTSRPPQMAPVLAPEPCQNSPR